MELKDFPSYGWVKKLNGARYFSGSAGTGPRTGGLTVHTFHYKVWTKEEKDDDGNSSKFLCVSCYVLPPQNSGKEIFGAEEKTFALSEENLEQAKAWLLQQLDRHDCIGKE
ncbi:MAG: hypothetical protein IJ106_10990 [Parasporobacterium sp.]|nr:hypothetical protein [Parasporobacterium sp.]